MTDARVLLQRIVDLVSASGARVTNNCVVSSSGDSGVITHKIQLELVEYQRPLAVDDPADIETILYFWDRP